MFWLRNLSLKKTSPSRRIRVRKAQFQKCPIPKRSIPESPNTEKAHTRKAQYWKGPYQKGPKPKRPILKRPNTEKAYTRKAHTRKAHKKVIVLHVYNKLSYNRQNADAILFILSVRSFSFSPCYELYSFVHVIHTIYIYSIYKFLLVDLLVRNKINGPFWYPKVGLSGTLIKWAFLV